MKRGLPVNNRKTTRSELLLSDCLHPVDRRHLGINGAEQGERRRCGDTVEKSQIAEISRKIPPFKRYE